MKEFVLLFRSAINPEFNPTQEQINQMMTTWKKWLDDIASKDNLSSMGNRLGFNNSSVVKPGNVVANGPYVEVKEFISGYTIIKTNSLDEAIEIAKTCPIVIGGAGAVEVRPVVKSEDFK